MRQIYLDNSATTPICEEALEKYIELSRGSFGNPSSLHALGFSATKVLNEARQITADSVGAKGATVIFTASGSEANNLAITGRAYSKERFKRGAKIITTEGEHASVDAPLELLKSCGFKVVKIPTVGGKLDTGALISEMTPDVVLVSMMMVNNETGALYDLKTVSDIMKARAPMAYLHIDATQSYMKVPFTLSSLGADMVTLSSHKIEGPKGVGALVVSQRVIKEKGIVPLVLGGGQEAGFRSGTENVPGIAAFAEAIRVAKPHILTRAEYMNTLREELIMAIEGDSELSEISVTKPERHAPHILNITLPKIKSETMLHYLSGEGIYISSGSACSSNGTHASSALLAYGRTASEADSSIRISFSYRNTKEDVDELCRALKAGLKKLSRMR